MEHSYTKRTPWVTRAKKQLKVLVKTRKNRTNPETLAPKVQTVVLPHTLQQIRTISARPRRPLPAQPDRTNDRPFDYGAWIAERRRTAQAPLIQILPTTAAPASRVAREASDFELWEEGIQAIPPPPYTELEAPAGTEVDGELNDVCHPVGSEVTRLEPQPRERLGETSISPEPSNQRALASPLHSYTATRKSNPFSNHGSDATGSTLNPAIVDTVTTEDLLVVIGANQGDQLRKCRDCGGWLSFKWGETDEGDMCSCRMLRLRRC